jgi:hypothetical protein
VSGPRATWRRTSWPLSVAWVFAVASGCADSSAGLEALKPKITTLSAAPMSVAPGESAVLRYAAADASTVRIDILGGAALLPSTPMLSGEVPTGPLDQTTTFVLTARRGDEASTKSITVIVSAPPSATIATFTSNPSMVNPMQSVTLSWMTSGAVSGLIRNGSGVAYMIAAEKLGQGNWTIDQLIRSETYTLSVTGRDGVEMTRSVDVVLNGPQIISFAAMPNPIMRGQTTQLGWNVRNAVQVAILSSSSNEPLHQGQDLTGSITVQLLHTEVFKLVATDGQGRKTTAVDTVVVNPPAGAPLVISFSAEPGLVNLGDAVALSWQVDDAPEGIEILEGGSVISATTAESGRLLVHPSRATTYTLIAKNTVFNDASAQATVRVIDGVPAIVRFAADPIEAPPGTTIDLDWFVVGAIELKLFAGDLLLKTISSGEALRVGNGAGLLASGATRYRLVARNLMGSTEALASVSVSRAAVGITGFSVHPDRLDPLATATVTVGYTSFGASSVELYADGRMMPGFPKQVSTASAGAFADDASLAIRSTTRFDLVVTNPMSRESRSRIVDGSLAEVEPNDTPMTAQSLGVLTATATLDVAGAIDRTSDEDYFSFTISTSSPGKRARARIQTYEKLGDPSACATDDTEAWLYSGIPTSFSATTHRQDPAIISYDDDEGPGFCSRLAAPDTQSPTLVLEPGTYILRVRRYQHEATIPRYFVRIDLF